MENCKADSISEKFFLHKLLEIGKALINAVMKYLNFRNSGSKLGSVTCKFTKDRTPSQ